MSERSRTEPRPVAVDAFADASPSKKAAEAAESPPSRDAALSSGPSPTVPSSGPCTVHLIGAGKVGRAFLRRLAETGLRVRLVAASDRSATVYAPVGLDGRALAGWKDSGRSFAAHPRAADIPLDVALSVVNAQIVVDCTSSDLAPAVRAAAARRARFLLDQGRHVVLAAKTPLLAEKSDHVAHGLHEGARGRADFDFDLLAPARRERLHVNAVFGGTGAALLDELDELRAATRRIVCVPNATTSVVLDERARGASLRDALAAARARGLTEHAPLQDLDGRDAALKLALLVRLVFGEEIATDVVARPGARALLRATASATTRPVGRAPLVRLVGRAERGARPELSLESVEAGSRLAVPGDRVVYAYELADGRTRVHVGAGLGPEGTARALLADVERAIAIEAAAARRAA